MPEIADATAFFQPTVSEIVWMEDIADKVNLVPTAAEIASGLRLMNELYDVTGFTGEQSWITRRNGGSRVDGQLAGKYTLAASSITFTMDKEGTDAAAEFAVDPEGDEALEGYLLYAIRGLVTARPAKTFHCEVAPAIDVPSWDGSDYPRITIPFGIHKVKDIVIPTLTP
ncbi:hypothetical protein [Blastococcus sp. CCUG 61487]|uniref:hypothetical protein n=1 Tax=Blastococcus sp. CCUG 61487 TaxID=1840703 RepID=UPI0010BFF70C|nr:hypothetical protein [Blastococcus sp. CCUG 61487]TKJ24365.1 hypothetical protein A6V29_05040 [Blastococcus sp. CCUG 61487]